MENLSDNKQGENCNNYPSLQCSQIIENKEYDLKNNSNEYKLNIETFSNGTILFELRKIEDISYYYTKTYTYEEIITILVLSKQINDNISKVLKFYDTALERKAVYIDDKKYKNQIALVLKRTIDFEEIETYLILEQCQIPTNEIFEKLYHEIKLMKKNYNYNILSNSNDKNIDQNIIMQILNENNQENKDEIKKLNENIQKLIQDNEETEKLKESIKELIGDKNEKKKMIDKINELTLENEENKKKINELKNENIQLLKEIDKLKKNQVNESISIDTQKFEKKDEEKNILNNLNNDSNNLNKKDDLNITDLFSSNPSNLKFNANLTNNHSSFGILSNFEIFTGIKDKIDYLVYNNKDNFNLEILDIKKRRIMVSLKGHKKKTRIIRYYAKENKEEYILSGDELFLILIWDINKNYEIKHSIQYKGIIYDGLLLFNIFNKDYILLSCNFDEETKLFEFKENTPFLKNIYGTKDNETKYMIPWNFNNKYYLIECCDYKISINNIFEDESYATLTMDPEGSHNCAYLYNNNFLCVSDIDNNNIRIWDLLKKSLFKQIEYDATIARGIIGWNNTYGIVACKNCFVIINIDEGKVEKTIDVDNCKIEGLKKYKLNGLGECLIASDDKNNILLYNI